MSLRHASNDRGAGAAKATSVTAAYDRYKSAPPRELHRGRGASGNPANRFEALHVELDPVDPTKEADLPKLGTRFYRDATKTIIARNNSPDVGRGNTGPVVRAHPLELWHERDAAKSAQEKNDSVEAAALARE